MIPKTIEELKDAIASSFLSEAEKIKIQALATQVRSELNLYDRDVLEARTKQNVYAEVCEKMLNRILDRNWD